MAWRINDTDADVDLDISDEDDIDDEFCTNQKCNDDQIEASNHLSVIIIIVTKVMMMVVAVMMMMRVVMMMMANSSNQFVTKVWPSLMIGGGVIKSTIDTLDKHHTLDCKTSLRYFEIILQMFM